MKKIFFHSLMACPFIFNRKGKEKKFSPSSRVSRDADIYVFFLAFKLGLRGHMAYLTIWVELIIGVTIKRLTILWWNEPLWRY